MQRRYIGLTPEDDRMPDKLVRTAACVKHAGDVLRDAAACFDVDKEKHDN